MLGDMDDNMNVKEEKINRSAWMTLVILSCIGLVTMYGETMVLPAIPDFIKDFKISYNYSSWILSSYLIAGAVITPIGGKLSDIYGKKSYANYNGDLLCWNIICRLCQQHRFYAYL